MARKIGRPKGYVYAMLKLALLPEKASKALREGVIPKTTAQLLARIPDGKARADAAKRVVEGRLWHNSDKEDEPLSYRQALALVHRDYMVELKKAPFGRGDAELLPSAGACTTCPKMTGNNRAEYPDGRADVCTDPPCFQEKCKAHALRNSRAIPTAPRARPNRVARERFILNLSLLTRRARSCNCTVRFSFRVDSCQRITELACTVINFRELAAIGPRPH